MKTVGPTHFGFCLNCLYIMDLPHKKLNESNLAVGKVLIINPESFLPPKR